MYADDHQIYTTEDKIKNSIKKAVQELMIDPNKCQIITIDPKFSKKEPVHQLLLQIDNQV